MDIHPTFWNQLASIFDRDDVLSIDKVKSELEYFEDDLKIWIDDNIESSFWKKSGVAIPQYALIQNWAHDQIYNNNALTEFAQSTNADPFLVAYGLYLKSAKDIDSTVVTLEVSAPESKRSIKIPDVCNPFGIKCIDNNQFYREIQAVF